jgi:uncharacterized membrane protein
MTKITRSSIRLLARHSDWRPEELDAALDEHVRADAERWRWLLRLLLPAIGIGFLACGILFFFAYNWSDIPKLGKLSIATVAVVVPCVLSLVPAFSKLTRNMLLTAAAFLVGPLFGVFGQIYQTGANAYDLFLAWCLFILVWVVAINFAPLWVLFLVLVNTTVSLYFEQIASGWSFVSIVFILFLINTVAATAFFLLDEQTKRFSYPDWLKKTTALAAIVMGTICCCTAIVEYDERTANLFYLIPILAVFAGVGWAALRFRVLYHLTLLALAVIAIVAAIIIRFDLDTASMFVATLWVVGGTTGSIIILNNLRKAWYND